MDREHGPYLFSNSILLTPYIEGYISTFVILPLSGRNDFKIKNISSANIISHLRFLTTNLSLGIKSSLVWLSLSWSLEETIFSFRLDYCFGCSCLKYCIASSLYFNFSSWLSSNKSDDPLEELSSVWSFIFDLLIYFSS